MQGLFCCSSSMKKDSFEARADRLESKQLWQLEKPGPIASLDENRLALEGRFLQGFLYSLNVLED